MTTTGRRRRRNANARGRRGTRRVHDAEHRHGRRVASSSWGVAAYVFYDRSKKKDGAGSSNSNSNQAEAPKGFRPPVPGGPSGAGVPGGGGQIDQGGNTGGGKKPIGTPGQPITLTSPAGYKITFPGQYWSNERAAEEMKKRSGLTGAAHECEVGPVQMLCVHLDIPRTSLRATRKSSLTCSFRPSFWKGHRLR